MAIFASTTTSGYSDPMKALSIKALEKRQADIMAQNAQAPGITPENTQTPIQGIGHVVNQLADSFKEGRAMAAVAAQRESLARVMAQVDWAKGPTSEQLALIGAADPDTMRQALQTLAENRRAEAQNQVTMRGQDVTSRGQDLTAQTTTRGQDLTSAAAAASNETTQRGQDLSAQTTTRGQDISAQTTTRGQDIVSADTNRGQDVQVRGQDLTADTQNRGQDITVRGQDIGATTAEADRLSREKNAQVTADAAVAAAASDPVKVKARAELEQQLTQKNAMVSELDDAARAFEKGINLGPGASTATAVGQIPIVGGYLADADKAARTKQFMNTMDKVATGAMSTILKGATTDKEMAEFKRMYNDPNVPFEAKVNQFNRVLEAAKVDRDIEARAVSAVGGQPQTPATATAVATPGATADPLEGRTASGPDGPMIRRNGKWEKQ